MKKKFYKRRFDHKQFKRKTIKDFRRLAGLSKKRAYYEFKRKDNEEKNQEQHCEKVFNFFKNNNIKIIKFTVLAKDGYSELLFDTEKRNTTDNGYPDLTLSNINNSNHVNFDNLSIVPLFAYCASIGSIYEPERAKNNADYLLMITFRAFIESLLYYKYDTFNLLQKEYKNIKNRVGKEVIDLLGFDEIDHEKRKRQILEETDAKNKIKKVIELLKDGE